MLEVGNLSVFYGKHQALACIALAPVPTTATRFPVTSRSSGQRAEWNSGPRNVSKPGNAGICPGVCD